MLICGPIELNILRLFHNIEMLDPKSRVRDSVHDEEVT